MYEKYYMTLRVDIQGNNPNKAIKKLNEKIEEVLADESCKLLDKGYHTDMGWNWSKHINAS